MLYKRIGAGLLAAAMAVSLTACGFRSVPAAIEKLFAPDAPVSSPPAVPSEAGGSDGNESLFSRNRQAGQSNPLFSLLGGRWGPGLAGRTFAL